MQPLEGTVLDWGEGEEENDDEVMCLMALTSCMGGESTLNAPGMMIVRTKAQEMNTKTKTKTGIVQNLLFKFY